MKKAEVLKYCKEKAEEGYLTHLMLLEIYNDEDDIPDDFVDLVCHPPEPPKKIMLTMNLELYNALKQACADYVDVLKQIEHAKESIKKVSKS